MTVDHPTPKSRTELLGEAFGNLKLTIGGMELRRPSAGSISLLIDMGNALFTGSDDDGDQPESQANEFASIIEFLYVHAVPIDEVLDKIDDKPALRRAVRAFGMDVSFADLREFSDKFSAVRDRIESALVEADEESTDDDTPGKPSPISSPPTSTTSAAPPTPPKSDGSSGNSPSSAVSNTSTPPAPTTEAPPNGHPHASTTPANVVPMPPPMS